MKLLLALVLSFETSTLFADLCEGTKTFWTQEKKIEGANFSKANALDQCIKKAKQTLESMENKCYDSEGTLMLTPGTDCSSSQCRYYGKPISMWFCYHTLQFACCE